jgi:hypothetical protein
MQAFFNSLTNNEKIFEYKHLEEYLRTSKNIRGIMLTPGEINWLYDQICGDHVLEGKKHSTPMRNMYTSSNGFTPPTYFLISFSYSVHC